MIILPTVNQQYCAMEDRLQEAITTPQQSQEVTVAQGEENGSDHKSEMCIGWDRVTLLSGVVTGVTIITVSVTAQWNDTIRYHYTTL